MRSKLALSLIFSLSALLGASLHAQTVTSEQQKLKQYSDQVTRLEQANKDIAANLATQNKNLPPQRSALATAQKELDAAKGEVAEASARAKDDPSQLNQGRLENARFKQLLVQRKYDDANSGLQKTESDISRLKKTLQANQHRLESLHGEIADERALIARLAERERTEAQERQQHEAATAAADDARSKAQVEKLRQEHEAAIKEIERLKAMLAKKEAADKLAAGAPAAATAQKATGASAAATKTATAATVAGAAATAAAKTNAAANTSDDSAPTTTATASTTPVTTLASIASTRPAPAAKPVAAAAPTLSRANDSEAVRIALHQTEKLAAQGGSAPDKVLHIKRYTDGGLVRSEKTENLKYIGGGQYYGYTRVGSGPTDLVIGSHHWHTKFANSFTTFVFIFDDHDAAHPRLVLFDRALSSR